MFGQRQVLVIDSGLNGSEAFIEQIGRTGFQVTFAKDVQAGIKEASQQDFDAALIDWDVPGMDGADVIRAIKSENPALPLLIISKRDSEFDRVLGLELGADDYVPKPFSVLELGARIKAVLRRCSNTALQFTKSAKHGGMQIDFDKREVRIDAERIDLSATEFDILSMLVLRPGHVYARDEIVRHVWGFSTDNYRENVTAHINRMRRKIETDLNSPRFVHTVRGVGYRFATAEELV